MPAAAGRYHAAMLRLPRSACLWFTLPLTAQTVLTVGPGGYAQIQTAINAASNGDVIVVQGGSYAPFVLAKDLTLVAAPGALVEVRQSTPGLGTTDLHPPTLAHLRGLRFRNTVSFFLSIQTRVTGGTVHLADCVFESFAAQGQAALAIDHAAVVMQRCAAFGAGVTAVGASIGSLGGDGVHVTSGSLAASDCWFFGSNLTLEVSGTGGHGVVADAAFVQLANCRAFGGANSALVSSYPAGNGVRVLSDSDVFLADCWVASGNAHSYAGAAALVNLGTVPVQLARTTLSPGPGTPPGPGSLGPVANAPLCGLAPGTPPPQLGAPWPVGVRTTPTTPVLLCWSPRLAVSSDPLVAERLWLAPATTSIAAFGLTDATGALDWTFVVPASTSLLYSSAFVQAFAASSLPLRASVAIGGVLQ